MCTTLDHDFEALWAVNATEQATESVSVRMNKGIYFWLMFRPTDWPYRRHTDSSQHCSLLHQFPTDTVDAERFTE